MRHHTTRRLSLYEQGSLVYDDPRELVTPWRPSLFGRGSLVEQGRRAFTQSCAGRSLGGLLDHAADLDRRGRPADALMYRREAERRIARTEGPRP